jgi:CO/xanthine dehydrogenase Mo-binding subunit
MPDPDRAAPPDFELERYELFEGPRYRFEVDRRDFLKSFSTGLLVLMVVPQDAARAQQESGRGGGGDRMPADVNAWLHIGEDGAVTVFTGKTEIGQNIRTSLSQAVAEELKAPIAAVTLVMADTARTPFDQGTFGSRTTPTMNLQLRKVAAAARDVLAARAAAQWNVARDAVDAKDGRVHGPDGRSIGFGELVKGAPLVATVNDKTILESPKDWAIAGTAVPKINGRDFVTGRHRYTSDMVRDGMLHGRIVRPPSYGATLARADTSAAEAMAGVVVVRDGNFLGVAAPTVAAAARASAAIKVEWTAGSGASARTLFGDLKSQTEGDGGSPFVAGSVDEALTRGPIRIDAEYTVAYIAHAPLEPRAALAEWQDGRVTVWTGTQRPFGVQQELVDAFHLPPANVRVIVPDTGSAYGGKHTGDAAVEAARLARAAGKPVKLVWTREEEFAWAYFRPAGVIQVHAAAQKDGVVTAWDFHNYNSGPAAIRTPYDVANQRIAFHPARSPLRQGSYRGLAATANHFARESHMDDLAHHAGVDPLAFRLKNLRDDRLVAVLKAAAEKFGWTANGTGIGLACGVEKGGYTACCVQLDGGTVGSRGGIIVEQPRFVLRPPVRIRRIVVAFECGSIVNPDGLNNQVEGAIVQGLGGALFEAIDFDDGALTNGHFAQYRLPRFSDVPPIDVVLLDRRDLPPAGAGETPIVGLAPAIGNAIFSGTGTRVRSLPLIPSGVPSSTAR